MSQRNNILNHTNLNNLNFDANNLDVRSIASYTTQSSSDQLLKRNYNKEECLSLLHALGTGFTPDQAQKKSDALLNNIHKISISDPKKDTKQLISDILIGRYLYEVVGNCLTQGGEALISVVRSNLSLLSYINDLSVDMALLSEDFTSLEQTKSTAICPNESLNSKRLSIVIYEQDRLLLAKYRFLYQDRMRETKTETNDESANKNDTQIFEQTVEYNSYKEELEEFTKDKQYQSNLDFVTQLDLYESSIITNRKIDVQSINIKEKMIQNQVKQIFVQGLIAMINAIVQKLKPIMLQHINIKAVLNRNVIVQGDSITSPFSTENLSGIYAALFNEYTKAGLGIFCEMLMQLLSESSSKPDSDTQPYLTVQTIDGHLKSWIDTDLFSYMTKDHLFTVVLLHSYHYESKIRREGVQHVLEYSRNLELGHYHPNVGEYSEMPLYNELVRWIRDVVDKSLQFSKSSNQPSSKSNQTNNRSTDKQLETAALGQDIKKSSTPKNTSGGTQATGPYTSEVTRNANLYVGRYTYTATSQSCSPTCVHDPKCYFRQCTKCKMFGHPDYNCKQSGPLKTKSS